MFPLKDNIKTFQWPFITLALIVGNSFIFFQELALGESFILRYALVPSLVSLDNLGGFLSSMFLHGGWFHLLSNMWFLYIFGDNVEAYFGKLKFLLFYIFAGIVAAFTQYIIAPHSSIPILGASGAIAGVLGAYLVLFPRARIKTLLPIFVFITVVDIPVLVYLPYWFLLQLFSGVGQIATGTFADTGGVAFFAHAGGFAAGFLITTFYKRFARKRV